MKTNIPKIKLSFPRLLFVASEGKLWGDIQGDINNQTDLMTLLNQKVDLSNLGNFLVKYIAYHEPPPDNIPTLLLLLIDPQTGIQTQIDVPYRL
jgi:hypothetical protein